MTRMNRGRADAPHHALGAWVVCLGAALALSACGSDETTGGEKWETGEDLGTQADMVADAPDMSEPEPEEDMKVAPPDVDAPPVPTTIVTELSSNPVKAGSEVSVTCRVLDASGTEIVSEEILDDPAYRVQLAPQDALIKTMDLTWRAERAGDVNVACRSDALGLLDPSPEVLTVEPGPAHTVTTTLDRRTMVAGETATASCRVFDEYGNELEEVTPTLESSTMGDGVETMGLDATITKAGGYELSCAVDGASETESALLEVTPSIPAALVIARVPDQPVYGLGQLITIDTIVTDEYGNEITDAPLTFSSAPGGGTAFGTGRFRYGTEGTYTITASVDGPTLNMMPLTKSVDVLINGTGPSIDCVSPVDNAQLDQASGSQVTFRGKLADTNGIMGVTVNGQAVTLQPDGTFETTLTTRYGMNFIDIAATDSFNEQNSRTCAFQLSDEWADESQLVQDALILKLKQDAVDDNVGNDGLDSLNDLLLTVLNSQGLIDTVDAALVALGSPIYNDCLQDSFLGCLFRAKVDYLDIRVDGPNTNSIDLVNGGLRIRARINNLGVRAKVYGTPPTTRGWANFDYIEVDLTSDLKLQNGRPKVSLRNVNAVNVGNIDLDFSGFSGFLIDALEFLFEGRIKNLVRDTLRDFINTEFNKLLDGVVGGLDVSSLGQSFDIPRLDGQGNVRLGFSVDFSSIGVNTGRALFGLGVNFNVVGPPGKATNSLGAPYPSGAVKLDPQVSQPVGLAVHAVVLNKALHALWRGGFFDATIDGSTLGMGVPMGTTVSLQTNLPPMIVLSSKGDASLHLGGVRLGVVYPGLFEDPLNVQVGATADTSVSLNGDELRFGNITLNDFVFSAEGVSLDATTQDILETFLKNLIQNVVDTSLNNALPALPIPTFALPQSLSVYGLPVGAELGIRMPSLDSTNRHLILDGAFGIR